MGGKNHINITRTGRRYPNKNWASWRDRVVFDLREYLQPMAKSLPLKGDCGITIYYTPADNRRRDAPAVLDSLWHIFEKVGIAHDDSQFKNVHLLTFPSNKEEAGAEVEIVEIKEPS